MVASVVPISIKNAKDQGLSLNPSKVSGQCGRLKCCLVYEQSTYAEARKGLPKLGKRVYTKDVDGNNSGDGRVVEVDVLHRRIRVSHGEGRFEVYKADQVEPMFASQPQGKPRSGGKSAKRSQKDSSGKGHDRPSSEEAKNQASENLVAAPKRKRRRRKSNDESGASEEAEAADSPSTEDATLSKKSAVEPTEASTGDHPIETKADGNDESDPQ